ncbi:MAG: hypothetical protein AAF416_03855 [Pseudomonadota bacterium]
MTITSDTVMTAADPDHPTALFADHLSEGHPVAATPSLADARDDLPTSRPSIETLLPMRFGEEIARRAKALTRPYVTQYAFFAREFQKAQDLRAHFKRDLGPGKTGQLSTELCRGGVPGFGGPVSVTVRGPKDARDARNPVRSAA